MTDMKSVIAYQVAMEQTQKMFKSGIISYDELLCIEAVLAGKYRLKSGSIYRENDLLYISNRANMLYYGEVKKDAEDHKEN